MALSASTRIAGVIGWPVAHSRSPRLHNHWLARYGLDGVYLAFPVPIGQVETAVRGLAAAGVVGLNVTLPHKQAAVALCDDISDVARRIGAVNTLHLTPTTIVGDNSDGTGFLANLYAHGVDPCAGPALVLGAGGAARAIVASLRQIGAPVTLTNRTRERADALAGAFPGTGVCDWADGYKSLADYALLVNTTSAGMHGHPLDFPLHAAREQLAVADLVYVPRETMLIRAAAERGLRVAPGLGMLLHQARPAFAAWFGVEPAIDLTLIHAVAGDIALQ